MTTTEFTTALSDSDILSITERLDSIINILTVSLVIMGMILGSLLFRHFRK